uniref:Uncharacterized protein n=1 Tax=Meloidogyne incognita TaxID=6306 RepID=A0A914ML82_MELIC
MRILRFILKEILINLLFIFKGFTLSFHFAKNPYFTDSVLQKHYQLQIGLSDKNPFDYDGPTVVKSKGCEINWNAGKDVTTKTVKNESFFNFFENVEQALDDDLKKEEEEKIRDDFETGQIIRDQIVSRAALIFTGKTVSRGKIRLGGAGGRTIRAFKR